MQDDTELTPGEKMAGFSILAAIVFSAGLYFGNLWFNTKDVVKVAEPATEMTKPVIKPPPAPPPTTTIIGNTYFPVARKRVTEFDTETGYKCFLAYHSGDYESTAISCIRK